jgi:hypothetical protein
VAPNNVVLISSLVIFVEVALLIDTFIHLQMLENVFSKEVIGSLSWASISIQELKD